MNHHANNEHTIPSRFRWSISNALHADDPQSLIDSLDACKHVERESLLTDQTPNIFSHGCRWTSEEVEGSPVKGMDNTLHHILYLNRLPSQPASLHTLVFVAAAASGCVRIVTLLISDMHMSDVDPAYNSNQAIIEACKYGRFDVVKLLLIDKRVDPAACNNRAILNTCTNGHIEVIKLLLSDKRIDPSARNNHPIISATFRNRIEVVRLLLNDQRVDPSVHPSVIRKSLEWADIEILRLLLADERVIIANEFLSFVDHHDSSDRVDALFEAALPRVWPRVIGNNLSCLSRENGKLRRKLDELELESSWVLLLCVKCVCTSSIAARVGDVLREVCEEWMRYQSEEYLIE